MVIRGLSLGITLALVVGCGSSTGGQTNPPVATKPPGAATSLVVRMVDTGSTYAFQPTHITVHPGTIVTWMNDSTADHTVTADSGAWSSANISHGQSYRHTFSEPGRYAYVCGLHGYMTGVVVVK